MCQNWNPGDPLPRAQDAEIDPRKFAEYSMNPNNPKNKGKWMAFAAIGYDMESSQSRSAAAQDVINQLRQSLSNAPATEDQSSVFGVRFQVMVQIKGPNGGEGTLVTKWQIDNSRDIPRLITNWLKVSQE